MTSRAHPYGYVAPLPQTDPYRSLLGIHANNVLARYLKNYGLVMHSGYVDGNWPEIYVGAGPTHEPAITSFALLPSTVTLAQCDEILNALVVAVRAHGADGQFAHLAVDTTSPAITAPPAIDTATRVALALQLRTTMYAHWHGSGLAYHFNVANNFAAPTPSDDATTRVAAREMYLLYIEHIQSAALEFTRGTT